MIAICPKCKSKNVFFTPCNRKVDVQGNVTIKKRYTCLDCNHNFDYYAESECYFS